MQRGKFVGINCNQSAADVLVDRVVSGDLRDVEFALTSVLFHPFWNIVGGTVGKLLGKGTDTPWRTQRCCFIVRNLDTEDAIKVCFIVIVRICAVFRPDEIYGFSFAISIRSFRSCLTGANKSAKLYRVPGRDRAYSQRIFLEKRIQNICLSLARVRRVMRLFREHCHYV